MISTRLLTCADSVVVDQRSNRISILNVIEEIQSPAFPSFIPKVTLVAFIERDAADPDVFDQLTFAGTLENNELFRATSPFNFAGNLKGRQIFDVQGIVLLTPGTLRFDLLNGQQVMASWSVEVTLVGNQPPQAVPVQVPPAPAPPVGTGG